MDHTWWRKYENQSGRWTSPDPLRGTIANPQSFNAYIYAANDPVNFVDPTGLDPQDPTRPPTTNHIDPYSKETVPVPGPFARVDIGAPGVFGGGDGNEWVTQAVINPTFLNQGGGSQNPTPNDCLDFVSVIDFPRGTPKSGHTGSPENRP